MAALTGACTPRQAAFGVGAAAWLCQEQAAHACPLRFHLLLQLPQPTQPPTLLIPAQAVLPTPTGPLAQGVARRAAQGAGGARVLLLHPTGQLRHGWTRRPAQAGACLLAGSPLLAHACCRLDWCIRQPAQLEHHTLPPSSLLTLPRCPALCRVWAAGDLAPRQTLANGPGWVTDCLFVDSPAWRKLVVAAQDRTVGWLWGW